MSDQTLAVMTEVSRVKCWHNNNHGWASEKRKVHREELQHITNGSGFEEQQVNRHDNRSSLSKNIHYFCFLVTWCKSGYSECFPLFFLSHHTYEPGLW